MLYTTNGQTRCPFLRLDPADKRIGYPFNCRYRISMWGYVSPAKYLLASERMDLNTFLEGTPARYLSGYLNLRTYVHQT